MRKLTIAAAAAVLAVFVLPGATGASARHAAAPPTAAPAFAKRFYRLRAGRKVAVRTFTRGVWHQPRTCVLTLAGPGYRVRRFAYRFVEGDLLLNFRASRRVRAGVWHLRFGCKAAGARRSALARATIRVSARHGGHRPLVGTGGPYVDALQPTNGALGFGGVGVPPNPFPLGECTWYAYQQRPDIFVQSNLGGAPSSGWDAYRWAQYASEYGHFAEGQAPVVGAIMVEPANPNDPNSVGHVAYVSQVNDPGHFVTLEMHTYGGPPDPNHVYTVYNDFGAPADTYYRTTGQLHRHVAAGTVFIYGGQAVVPTQYAGYQNHIVQWSGDTKAQKTSWLVVDEGGQLHRHWIPDIPTFWCLRNSGAQLVQPPLDSTALDQMPDDTGVWASCSGNTGPPGGGGGGASGEPTVSETEGNNGVNTFTDPTTATGLGPRVAPAQQVQVSCKVYAPQIPSVNPDGYWYRIASAPWNDAFYAPANTFMNGDPWGGPYTHNTDYAVPDCGGGGGGGGGGSGGGGGGQTWPETTGGVAHTWTDYVSAGGTEGPDIGAYQTLQIACKVQGFRVADGNVWWYRIASSPWNSTYYVSADAFYNNGQTSGSLQGTPFVDSSVANC